MDQAQTPVKMEEQDFSKILIAVLVIILTIIFFVFYQRRKSVRRAILFTGLCDTGKTLLYARLVHKKFIQTQTSIRENIGDYVTSNGMVRIVDIPGHERVRNKFFDKYKPITRAIVYVIDSVTIQKEVRDVAEYLYNIITDSLILTNAPAILILCNKQDLPLSKGSNVIKSILEKEMNTLRVTKSSQLESVDPKTKKNAFLGDEKRDFDFSQLNQKVEFCEANATTKDDKDSINLEELNQWLVKVS